LQGSLFHSALSRLPAPDALLIFVANLLPSTSHGLDKLKKMNQNQEQ
jgi:hypothetical protein